MLRQLLRISFFVAAGVLLAGCPPQTPAPPVDPPMVPATLTITGASDNPLFLAAGPASPQATGVDDGRTILVSGAWPYSWGISADFKGLAPAVGTFTVGEGEGPAQVVMSASRYGYGGTPGNCTAIAGSVTIHSLQLGQRLADVGTSTHRTAISGLAADFDVTCWDSAIGSTQLTGSVTLG